MKILERRTRNWGKYTKLKSAMNFNVDRVSGVVANMSVIIGI